MSAVKLLIHYSKVFCLNLWLRAALIKITSRITKFNLTLTSGVLNIMCQKLKSILFYKKIRVKKKVDPEPSK